MTIRDDSTGKDAPFDAAVTAADVAYDPTASGLTATNVQAGLDEVAGGSGGGGPFPAVTGATADEENTYSGTGTFKVFRTEEEDVVLALGITGEPFPRVWVLTDGQVFIGDGTADLNAGTALIAFNNGRLELGGDGATKVTHDLIGGGKGLFAALGAGNAETGASLLGTVIGQMEIFNEVGVSVGFLPIYDAIT